MKKTVTGVCLGLLLAAACCVWLQAQQLPDQAHWAQWRGPYFNGMARGDGPTVWSDTSNIKWKTDIPGRGHSTPVIWGDKIFLTTAIPTGKPAPTPREYDYWKLIYRQLVLLPEWAKLSREERAQKLLERIDEKLSEPDAPVQGKALFACRPEEKLETVRKMIEYFESEDKN